MKKAKITFEEHVGVLNEILEVSNNETLLEKYNLD